MKRCVVSFANGHYLPKLDRLVNSLKDNTDADILTFTTYEEIGCKPHTEVPYQFKPYAIWEAIQRGYDSILWCDSPIIAVQDISPVFEHIEKHGYLFFNNYGHPLGKWTNQTCLDHFGYTREEAMKIKQIMACCMGFRIDSEVYGDVEHALRLYKSLSDKLYPGSWADHRHDQTVMSFLIEKHGFVIEEGHKTFFIYDHFKQVPEFQPIADSVCLISQ